MTIRFTSKTHSEALTLKTQILLASTQCNNKSMAYAQNSKNLWIIYHFEIFLTITTCSHRESLYTVWVCAINSFLCHIFFYTKANARCWRGGNAKTQTLFKICAENLMCRLTMQTKEKGNYHAILELLLRVSLAHF